MSANSEPITWRLVARDAAGSAIRARPCGRARAHVLLVESDAVIADLFVTILEDEGYAVERAGTPGDAVALLDARCDGGFDLVLSVPFADPLDAPYTWLDRLRAVTDVPIVICARCPAVFYADHHDHGYAAFLEEPFDVQRLIDLVAALCPHRRAPVVDRRPDVEQLADMP